jgi:hypothetical protein
MAKALTLVNGVPRMVEIISGTIYDEAIDIGVGGITTGVSIFLPNSQTYTGDELEVYLNGDFMEKDIDWTASGSDEIQMTFDLVERDRLRFRINHS